jgi:hypothetical protein
MAVSKEADIKRERVRVVAASGGTMLTNQNEPALITANESFLLVSGQRNMVLLTASTHPFDP